MASRRTARTAKRARISRKLTPHERRLVSAFSGVNDVTIRKWERDANSVQEASALRIESALKRVDAGEGGSVGSAP